MPIVHETKGLGLHCGKPWTILLMVISAIYLLVCFVTNLVTRIYLKAFYSTAHVAAVSIIVVIVLLYHHMGNIRKSLGISRKSFTIYQCIVSGYLLLCCLATSVGYTLLVARSVNSNYDYIGATWFGWMSSVLMAYLFGVVTTSCLTHQSDSYSLNKIPYTTNNNNTLSRIDYGETAFGFDTIRTKRKRSRTMYADDPNFNILGDPNNAAQRPTRPNHSLGGNEKQSKCYQRFCVTLTWFHDLLFQIILVVFFFMTSYHPYCVLSDVSSYRDADSLVTVRLDNHRAQVLFIRCNGNGSDVIVFENDERTTAEMFVDALPRYMADNYGYKVCVYDRSGKGWSEGVESDYIDVHQEDPLYSKNNVRFLRHLVKAAGIKTPFYYAGFGYGSHHLTYMALDYPQLVKGLIFINPAALIKTKPSRTNKTIHVDVIDKRRNALKSETWKVELFANLQPSGFIRLAEQIGIYSVEEYFEGYTNFLELPKNTKKSLIASLRSGSYFSTQVKENTKYISKDFAIDRISKDIKKREIRKKTVIVQSGNSEQQDVLNLFPRQLFPSFSTKTVDGASYNSVVMEKDSFMKTAAEFINEKLGET